VREDALQFSQPHLPMAIKLHETLFLNGKLLEVDDIKLYKQIEAVVYKIMDRLSK
jgi:hypothetical protein